MGLFKPLAKRRAMMRVVIIAALAVLTRPACAIDSGDLDCELMGETGAMSFTFAPVSRSADGRWGTMLLETSEAYKGERAQIRREVRPVWTLSRTKDGVDLWSQTNPGWRIHEYNFGSAALSFAGHGVAVGSCGAANTSPLSGNIASVTGE